MSQKEEFIEAIKNDEYYDWQLSENIHLETDHEFDGTFSPWLCVTDESLTEQEIDDIMVQNNVDEVFSWYGLEESHRGNQWVIHAVECEYEEIDFSYWK